MADNGIEIKYYIRGAEYASRIRSTNIPRKGDDVRLRGVLFIVTRVCWIEEAVDYPIVVIDLDELGVDDLRKVRQ